MRLKTNLRILLSFFILLVVCFNPPRAADRVVVSVIYSSDIEPYQQCWDGFKSYLGERNVAIWVSKYSLKEQAPEKIITQVSAEKPQLIFCLGTKATRLARLSFRNTPLIYALVLEPEEVKDPNMTGVLMDIPAKMKLGEIARILPGRKNIGILYSEAAGIDAVAMVQACYEAGLQTVAKRIASEKDLPEALQAMGSKIDCFIMVADTKIYFPQSVKFLLQESVKQKFPVVGLSRFYTKDGATLSFDCDYDDLGRQSGEIALRILEGARPLDIKPALPRKLNYSLNLEIADKIGIKFTPDIVKGAAFVFGDNTK